MPEREKRRKIPKNRNIYILLKTYKHVTGSWFFQFLRSGKKIV